MQLIAGAVNVSNFYGHGGGLCLLPHQSRCLVGRGWQGPAEPRAELLLSRRMRMCRAAPSSVLQTAWVGTPAIPAQWLPAVVHTILVPSLCPFCRLSKLCLIVISLLISILQAGWIGLCLVFLTEQLAFICQPPGCRS